MPSRRQVLSSLLAAGSLATAGCLSTTGPTGWSYADRHDEDAPPPEPGDLDVRVVPEGSTHPHTGSIADGELVWLQNTAAERSLNGVTLAYPDGFEHVFGLGPSMVLEPDAKVDAFSDRDAWSMLPVSAPIYRPAIDHPDPPVFDDEPAAVTLYARDGTVLEDVNGGV